MSGSNTRMASSEPKTPLIPDDVWQSYQEELEDERKLDEAEAAPAATPGFQGLSATTTADVEVAMLALSRVELFSQVDRASLQTLAEAARQGELPSGEHLFHEDQPAESFFVVVDGALEVSRRGGGRPVSLEQLKEGSAVGVFGLLTHRCREASAVALADSVILEIPGPALSAVITSDARFRQRVMAFYERRMVQLFLASSPIFAELDAAGRAAVGAAFVEKRLVPGEALVQPGEVNNFFAVVVTGQLMLEDRPKAGQEAHQFHLEPGQFAVVTSAFSGNPCRMKIYATSPTTLLYLGQRELTELGATHPAFRALPHQLRTHARALVRDVYAGSTERPA